MKHRVNPQPRNVPLATLEKRLLAWRKEASNPRSQLAMLAPEVIEALEARIAECRAEMDRGEQ